MFHTLVRRAAIVSSFTLPFIALTAESGLADKADFQVHNNSEIAITELYVSESSRDSWDNDILDTDVLATGSSIQVVFGDDSPNTCMYDILAIFADGQSVEDYRVNVCSSGGYSFHDE